MGVVPEAYVIKLSIFVVQRLVLLQNGVEFCKEKALNAWRTFFDIGEDQWLNVGD